MKNTARISILLILQLIFLSGMYSQCTQSNYTFATQEEVDNFPSDHPTCTEVTGRLSVIDSDIINLDSLIQINTIGTSIVIRGNSMLGNLEGLRSIIKCRSLEVSNNDNLIDAGGIANIQELDGTIAIINNPRIQIFVGLNVFENINSAVVTDNDSLFFLKAFNGVTNISQSLVIRNNPKLSTLEIGQAAKRIQNITIENLGSLVSFPSLDSLTVVDTLQIINNDKLILLPNLDSLQTVNGQLIIADNDTLNSISKLISLSIIVNGLFITNNRNLKEFTGSEKLQSIGEKVVIDNNDELVNIDGLAQVNFSAPDTLIISNNRNLEICGNPFVCDYIRSESQYHEISNNFVGCNTTDEVLAWCVLDTKSLDSISPYLVYPNPVMDLLYIDADSEDRITRIDIYNSIGQLVLSKMDIQDHINTSDLTHGNYYLQITASQGITTHTFIK